MILAEGQYGACLGKLLFDRRPICVAIPFGPLVGEAMCLQRNMELERGRDMKEGYVGCSSGVCGYCGKGYVGG